MHVNNSGEGVWLKDQREWNGKNHWTNNSKDSNFDLCLTSSIKDLHVIGTLKKKKERSHSLVRILHFNLG